MAVQRAAASGAMRLSIDLFFEAPPPRYCHKGSFRSRAAGADARPREARRADLRTARQKGAGKTSDPWLSLSVSRNGGNPKLVTHRLSLGGWRERFRDPDYLYRPPSGRLFRGPWPDPPWGPHGRTQPTWPGTKRPRTRRYADERPP